jgi:hypothetical protein
VFSIFVVFISLLIGLFSAACVHNVNNKDPAINDKTQQPLWQGADEYMICDE